MKYVMLFGFAIVLGAMTGLITLSLGNPKTQPTPAPSDSIQFMVTDDGAATASKYIRAYSRNLATLAKSTADKIRTTNSGSMDICKEWAKASEVARIEASKGVDARVAALISSQASREDCAKFIEEAQSAFEKEGK